MSDVNVEKDLVLLEKSVAVVKRISIGYPVIRAGIFGSVARGTEKPDSDFDVFAVFDDGVPLLEKGCYQQDLEEALGIPVDLLLSLDGVPSGFIENFARDAVTAYVR